MIETLGIGSVVFDPLVPLWAVAAFLVCGGGLITVAILRGGRSWTVRAAALLFLALALADPRIARESTAPATDIGLLIIDESASQRYGGRSADADDAVAAFLASAEALEDLELRTVRVRPGPGSNGTRLTEILREQVALVPDGRFAGAVIVTDGQIHDAPEHGTLASNPFGAPVHIVLTGKPGEVDRRVIVKGAPGYAIVDAPFAINLAVDDAGASITGRPVTVTLRRNGDVVSIIDTQTGTTTSVDVAVERSGEAIFEASVDALDGEVSSTNNRAIITVNGVRDRLRVLLVSGQPHNGERTWRNLLKSDPAVDLVHFTILRPPEKDDFTPLNELALITFPVQELFEEKLDDFDLIIFDRYIVRDVLPPSYMRNIARYLEAGGALLFADGPELAGLRSLFRTPLGETMPVEPTGAVIEQPFRPRLSADGARHPVTADLSSDPRSAANGGRGWGRWFRHVEAEVRRGHVVMTGAGGRALMVLDRVGDGRVAQILSDQIWLWARGYDGGGPHAETLRRMAHWLMREPDLEEEALAVRAEGETLIVERRSMRSPDGDVVIRLPNGTEQTLTLTEGDGAGTFVGTIQTDAQGLFTVIHDGLQAVHAVGERNPLEVADLRATAEPVAALAAATGGAIRWLSDGTPTLRAVDPDRDTDGRGWLGLKRGGVTTTLGIAETSLLPGWLIALLGTALLLAAWRRESR